MPPVHASAPAAPPAILAVVIIIIIALILKLSDWIEPAGELADYDNSSLGIGKPLKLPLSIDSHLHTNRSFCSRVAELLTSSIQMVARAFQRKSLLTNISPTTVPTGVDSDMVSDSDAWLLAK